MARTTHAASPKITRPRLFGIVARERLFARIAATPAPIVWIAAPPGAGKTILAASYVERTRRPAVWYHVDPGDADPASSFLYLRQAAAGIAGTASQSLPLLPAEASGNLTSFSRRYFRALFGMLPARSILVLDNFQDAEGSPFETLIRAAFDELPDDIGVLVASLSDPPATLTRFAANARMASIGADELRFSREESDQLVRSRVALDDDALASLHSAADGWAAGLVLMAEHLRRAPAGTGPVALAESSRAVFDYFAGEIIACASAEDQRALMLSALLPRITVALVEAASGHPHARRLLEYLSRRHLFVDRRDGPEIAYRFHGLFAAFLRTRVRECLPAADVTEATARAAERLEAQGAAEDAVTMYLAAGDFGKASGLIVEQARTLYEHGRWRTLLEWIGALPPQAMQREPWLAYWVGACLVWVNPPRAREVLEAAFHALQRAGDHDGAVLSAGALTRACILGPDWAALDHWIEALERLLAAPGVGRRALVIGYSRLLYAVLVRQPQNSRQREWAERAMAALDAELDPSERILAAFSLLSYYAWTGQTDRQHEIVRHIEPVLGDGRASGVSLTYWQWAYSTHLLRIAAPGEALAAIDRALELATDNGLAIAGIIRRHRIAHLLTLGRLDEAEAELGALVSAPRVEPHHELRAWLAMLRGDLASALDEANEALRMATRRGRTLYRMLDLALLAGISAEAGSHEAALAHLRAYRELARDVPGDYASFQADLVDAYVALRSGRRDACHRHLARAFEAGRRHRYASHWGWNPRMITALVVEALAQDICTPYARELVRMHRLVPADADDRRWPWPIEIRALGHFEVLIDGVPLRFEGKVQRKPIEMLKVMLALGPTEVPIDQLVAILWPGPNDGDARKTFDITLHRLRKLLGMSDAIRVSDCRVGIDRRHVFVDAWALDQRFEQLVPASALPPPPEALEAAAPCVLDAYRGHFLAGDPDMPWQLPLRNRLAGRFRRFALRLGEHFEWSQQWTRAESLYERAIELDATAETFYRHQMVCLQAQGRRAEALDVFHRCRHALSITLGIRPGNETESLYRDLLAG